MELGPTPLATPAAPFGCLTDSAAVLTEPRLRELVHAHAGGSVQSEDVDVLAGEQVTREATVLSGALPRVSLAAELPTE
jgi:hypothetical protein